ncbi:hypothetical protein BHE90_002179 [Fusarium euwallaceae]|uniref:Uncharacterized protein n=4 Tax=Fusarium solani species complex TaxID=232080 RepID=A0A3M2SM66_9HYPO|nr:hypothetical protein CDV36_001960 [Fusarium kuroshium]RSL77152.1 hypothetical protein CEP51_009326 [Fusarium floridanum]RSM09698.1 hypothetical protein CEP52_003969 [Fusarium oligoseptatum]RTE83302.1 hypothetical protein BHE90_002179 [Fusarium euwallaceae]
MASPPSRGPQPTLDPAAAASAAVAASRQASTVDGSRSTDALRQLRHFNPTRHGSLPTSQYHTHLNRRLHHYRQSTRLETLSSHISASLGQGSILSYSLNRYPSRGLSSLLSAGSIHLTYPSRSSPTGAQGPRSAPGLSLSTRGSLSSAGPTLLFRSFQHGSFHPRQYTPPL